MVNECRAVQETRNCLPFIISRDHIRYNIIILILKGQSKIFGYPVR